MAGPPPPVAELAVTAAAAPLSGDPPRAEPPAGLLVDDGDHLQLPVRGTPAGAGEHCGGHDLGGGLRLHIDRAAPPQAAVGDLAGPRVAAPVVRVGEDGVDVGE